MTQYIIAGLVLGGIYAISAAGIVVTYVSAGILNFAFAALAYFMARFYYFLHVQYSWSIWEAAVVAVLLTGPVLGVLLYFALFRMLRQSSTLVKVVATIGLSVAIPAIANMLFGNVDIVSAPGLAPVPVHVFHVVGAAVTLDQLIAYISVVAVLIVGVLFLRFTDAGLKVRAMVDSEALTSISGINPSRVAIAVWAVSIFMAGLAGILSAPVIGLNSDAFQVLIAAAFAAVVAARLRSLSIAVFVGLAMGIIGSLAQWALPRSSTLAQNLIPSIPFIFIAVFLAYHLLRHGSVSESGKVGGALDRSIQPQGAAQVNVLAKTPAETGAVELRGLRHALLDTHNVGAVISVAIMALLPLVLHGFWGGLAGEAMAYAVVFLSMTLVTGEGGMIWLCQITFAGVGAITTAQLATNHGWPVLPALIIGGLIAGALGAIIGFLTIRLGDLYVALVTLTFALLMSNLVFNLNIFYQEGAGVSLSPPSFASKQDSFTYFSIVVFIIIGFFVFNLRRSTPGLALSAIRSSQPGARSVGLSVVQMKVVVSVFAAFVAGVGGGLLAIYSQAAIPDSYTAFIGLTWMAVLVAVGVRSNAAAIVAGAAFTFVPALFVTYLPKSLAEVPTALFGLGAVLIASNPEGSLALHVRLLGNLVTKFKSTPASSLPRAGATDVPRHQPTKEGNGASGTDGIHRVSTGGSSELQAVAQGHEEN